jgi:hypothetical protein
MNNTTITTTDTQITVTGPYNSEFIAKARRLAGKWHAPSWVFDIRDENAVRAACLKCYGTDGHTTDLVDVRVTIPHDGRGVGGARGPIELFGRTLARAFGRDSGAKLGDGVVVEAGGFGSGGSMKNWTTTVKDDTVVVLRDVSRALVDAHDNDDFIVAIIGGAAPDNRDLLVAERRTLLMAERRKLLDRVAEINALLDLSNECPNCGSDEREVE